MGLPPRRGRSESELMELWRNYLEHLADKEGDVPAQTIVAAYHSIHVLTAISHILDQDSRYKPLIDKRFSIFEEAARHASTYKAQLLNASFSIYNCLNTLAHQLTQHNSQAAELIRNVDDQVQAAVASATASARPAIALRAAFPLLGLLTLAADEQQVLTEAIRHVEHRFSSGALSAQSDQDHLLNALYRMVEMFQIFALATDSDLKDRIEQIAARFQEEDVTPDLWHKSRNGFCRFFELGHLIAVQVDALLSSR